MLFRTKLTQSEKYIKILDEANLKEVRSIDETIIKLKVIKGSLYSKKLDELKLIHTEIKTLIEDYKKDSLFTSMIATMVILTTIIITVLRELPTTLPSESIIKGVINIIFAGGFLVSLLLLFKSYAGGSKRLNQVNNVLELIIEEREYIDKQHSEALIEYYKYLKEGSPIT